MIALCWLVVFQLTHLLILHHFFWLLIFLVCQTLIFSSAPELKLINSPFLWYCYLCGFSNFMPNFQQVIFMQMIICIYFYNSSFLIMFTYIFHDNISLMVSHNTFIFCGTNYWSIYIIIYSRWINFCILVYIGIFITNSYCFSPRNYLECLTWG